MVPAVQDLPFRGRPGLYVVDVDKAVLQPGTA